MEYDDQSDPEWNPRSASSVETFSFPRISTKSAQAACRFEVEVLCRGGAVSTSEDVEDVGRAAGLRDPRK